MSWYLRGAIVLLILGIAILMSGCGLTKEDLKPLEERLSKLEDRVNKLESGLREDSSKFLKEEIKKLEAELEAIRKQLYAKQERAVTKSEPEVSEEEPSLEEPPLEELREAEDIATLPRAQKEAIESLIDRGIITLEDGKFKPNEPITLGELLSWAAKLKGKDLNSLRSELKLPSNLKDGTKLTREMLVTILLELSPEREKVRKLKPKDIAKYLSTDSSNIPWGKPLYTDYREISKRFAKHVAYAVYKSYYCRVFGIERRYWEDPAKKPSLKPKKLATRAEAAYALKLILER